jgi:hypothetical protein
MEETTEENQITPLEARRQEVAQYQKNIAMYKSIYETLPNEWPEHLEEYRNIKNRHETAGNIEDLEDLELLSKLWQSEDIYKAIRTETLEMIKAKNILDFMELQQD